MRAIAPTGESPPFRAGEYINISVHRRNNRIYATARNLPGCRALLLGSVRIRGANQQHDWAEFNRESKERLDEKLPADQAAAMLAAAIDQVQNRIKDERGET